jgi:hypothetical protein
MNGREERVLVPSAGPVGVLSRDVVDGDAMWSPLRGPLCTGVPRIGVAPGRWCCRHGVRMARPVRSGSSPCDGLNLTV